MAEVIELRRGKIVPRNRWRTMAQREHEKIIAKAFPVKEPEHGLCTDPHCPFDCGLLLWLGATEETVL